MADVLESLRSALAERIGVRVMTDVPSKAPASYVQLTRSGGGRSAFLDTPYIACTCQAGSDAEAYALASSVLDALERIEQSDDLISSVRIDYFQRADRDGRHRYVLTFEAVANRY